MSLTNLSSTYPLTVNGLDTVNIGGNPFDPNLYVSKVDNNPQTIVSSLSMPSAQITSLPTVSSGSIAVVDALGNVGKADVSIGSTTWSTVPYLNSSKTLVSSSVTPTELGYLSGTTSNIQTQLNSKTTQAYVDAQVATRVAKSGDTMTGLLTVPSLNVSGATASKVPIFDVSRNLVSSGVDSIKITYLDNVSSDIQTQLNSKASTAYVDSQDANLQTQINAKASTSYVDAADAVLQSGINARVNRSGDVMTGSLTVPTLYVSGATANTVPFFDGTKSLASSSTTSTELGYVSGVTSSIQTQLNSKATTAYVDAADANLQSQINTKASITYVDTQDANLQSQINTKASVTYVDTQDALRVPYTGATTLVNLGAQKIQSSTAPTTGNDLVNKTYADGLVTGFVPYTGATTTLNMGAQKVQSSTAPSTANDLTNKTYVDAQDSSLQTQINGKLSLTGGTLTGMLTTPSLNVSGATASTVAVFDGSKNLTSSAVSTTTLGYLDATSSIQTQLNTKATTTYVDTADVNLQNQINARATTSYVDTSVAARVPYTGATNAVDLGGNRILSTYVPSASNDLCNKLYVDTVAGGNITPNNNYWTGDNYFLGGFDVNYGAIKTNYITRGQTLASFTAVSGTITNPGDGYYYLTFPSGSATGSMSLTSFTFSNPTTRYRYHFTIRASTQTAFNIFQNNVPVSNGYQSIAASAGMGQMITGYFYAPLGITYPIIFRFNSLVAGSNVSWSVFQLHEVEVSIPTIVDATNIQGTLSIGNTSITSPLKLITYDAGATGWKGMVYFGNDNVGMVAGAYNNVVYIGGHTRALNAWSDIYLAPGGRVGVGMSGSRVPVSQFEIAGAAFNPLTLTRTGASTNFGVGTVHSLIDATNTFQAYYARTIGGSNGAVATTNQNQANGYYAIDLASSGVFGSDSSPFDSSYVFTNTQLRGRGSFTIGSVGVYEAGCIYSDTNWGMLFRAKQSPNLAQFAWYSHDGNELMRLNPSGNLGVGTGSTNPVQKLTVSGGTATTTLMVGTTLNPFNAVQYLYSSTADYTNSLMIETTWPSVYLKGTTYTNRDWVIINGGSGAGIGQGNFGFYDATRGSYVASFDGSGSFCVGNANGNILPKMLVVDSGNGTWNTGSWHADQSLLISQTNSSSGSAGALGLSYTSSNYGWICCLSPGVAWRDLVIAAATTYFAWFGSNVAYTVSTGIAGVSDAREKEDIQPLNTSSSLRRVLNAKPVHYRRKYIDKENTTAIPEELKQKRCVGFVAQEILESNPHCISEWENEDAKTEDDNGMRYGITYNDYVIHLVGAVHELHKRNELQQESIDILVKHGREQETKIKEQSECIDSLTQLLAEQQRKFEEHVRLSEERMNKLASLILNT